MQRFQLFCCGKALDKVAKRLLCMCFSGMMKLREEGKKGKKKRRKEEKKKEGGCELLPVKRTEKKYRACEKISVKS